MVQRQQGVRFAAAVIPPDDDGAFGMLTAQFLGHQLHQPAQRDGRIGGAQNKTGIRLFGGRVFDRLINENRFQQFAGAHLFRELTDLLDVHSNTSLVVV